MLRNRRPSRTYLLWRNHEAAVAPADTRGRFGPEQMQPAPTFQPA